MTTTIVTTFDPSKYEQYGEEMLRSLNESIQDDNVQVVVYYDGDPNQISHFNRCTPISFKKACGSVHQEFLKVAKKKQKSLVTDPPNSRKYEDERQFLYDAARFSYKWFALIEASKQFAALDTDYLVWLDADVVATRPFTENFFKGLLPQGNLMAYLGRLKPYTETGFLVFDIANPYYDAFFYEMEDLYHYHKIFNLSRWIDCVAFDHAREKVEAIGAKTRDLTPGMMGHVWELSPLACCLTHNKGLRKVS